MASMLATVCPASTVSPTATRRVTTPGERRGDVPVVARLGLLGRLGVHLDGAVPHLQRAQLAVEGGQHGPHALGVGLADGLEPGDELDAPAEGDGVLGPGAQAVQVVEGVEHRHVAVGLADLGQARRRPGEQQPVEGAAPQRRVGVGAAGRPRPRARAARRAPGAVRPSSARVRNGSGQPPGGSPSSPDRNPTTESGMSNFAGSSAKAFGSAPTATRCRARSPTTLELGVTLTSRPRMRSAAAYIRSTCSNRSPRPSAIACWRRLDSCPPGISWS